MEYEGLPDDVIRYQLLKLPINDHTNYCRINRRIGQVCMSEEYWRLRLQQDYSMFTKPINIGSRDFYIKIYTSEDIFTVNTIDDFYRIPLGVKILEIMVNELGR